MEKKRIALVGEWGGYNLILDILKEKYDVEISSNPDYLIASPLCNPLEYMKFDCVRILFTGEPFSPDFNVFDYAIGFDYMSCLDSDGNDRYYRFPLCFCKDRDTILRSIYGMQKEDAEDVIKEKRYFCNFIYSHHSARGEREELFEKISRYKRVESAGPFKNNMPGNMIVPYKEKIEFLRKCKFTIAAESITSPGFVTEKIMDPICSSSIPVYFGSPFIGKEFNNKAIINCMEYDNVDDIVNRIIEVDTNEDLYLEMLMSPKCVRDGYYEELYIGLKEFLWRIFSERRDESIRRMDFYSARKHQDFLKDGMWFQNMKKNAFMKGLIKMYKIINE